MIDVELLRKLGWPDALISATTQLAEKLRDQQGSITETEVTVLKETSTVTSTTISIPLEAAEQSTWPRF